MLTYNEKFRELRNCEVFGAIDVFGGAKWDPCYVYAVETSIVAEINA